MSKAFGKNLILKSRRPSFDPARGIFVTEVWQGTEAAINGLIASLRPYQTWEINDSNAPIFEVTIRSPEMPESDQDDALITWEMIGNDLQKDIYEHPNALACDEGDIRKIRNAMNSSNSETSPAFTGGTTGSLAQIEARRLAAISLYLLVLKGTTAYLTSQYVLRKTEVVSTGRQIALGYQNVNRIWSSASINNAEGTPSPIDLSIAQIEAIKPQDQNGYAWGWLKKNPTLQQISGGKWQLTKEWWLEQWSVFIYGLPV